MKNMREVMLKAPVSKEPFCFSFNLTFNLTLWCVLFAELAYQSTPREGALNKFDGNMESANDIALQNDPLLKTFGSAMFPEEDTEEGVFYSELLSAIERWYTSHGWPGGMFPVAIPGSLRR